MRSTTAAVIGGLVAAAVFLAGCASASTVPSADPAAVVATVNGSPVVQAELERAMGTARAEVAAANGGRVAADRLRAAGLALAVQEKVLWLWAQEAGLLADVSEAGFQAALARENARREQARVAGRPLPGVPSYDEYTYAGLRAAELRKALADRVQVPEGRLLAHYKQLTAGLSGKVPTFEEAKQRVRLSLADQQVAAELAARVKRAS